MAIVTASVDNETNQGVSRGGTFFPPRSEGTEFSGSPVDFAEISACSLLKITSVDFDDEGSGSNARVLPDGLNSALNTEDSEEVESGYNEGQYSGGGGSSTDRTEDEQIPATKHARDLAEENSVSLVEVYENTTPSGAGGVLNKSDVQGYLDSNQSEEDQSEEEEDNNG